MKLAIYLLVSMMCFRVLAEDTVTTSETTMMAPVQEEPTAETPVATTTAAKVEKKLEPTIESEIPINLETTKAAKTDENPWVKLLLSVSVIGVLATAGYMYLKKSGYKNTLLKANQIKILTQFHLGPKKSLAIVRVAGESILIGVTDQNISLIKTLSLLDEELPEPTTHQFNTLLEEQPTMSFQTTKPAEEEEFAMTGIKNIVSQKIKNMRSI